MDKNAEELSDESPGHRKWVQFNEDGGQQIQNGDGHESEDPLSVSQSLSKSNLNSNVANNNNSAVIEPTTVEIVPPPSAKALRQQSASLQSSNTNTTSNLQISPKSTGSSSTTASPSYRQQQHHNQTPQTLNVTNLQNVELRNSDTNLSSETGGKNGTGIGGAGSGNSSGARRNASGFTNGDVIVSVLPINTRWPWVTPASFRPELVPEELMVPGLTLTVEEYVHAMELLTSDLRFNAYVICYKRLLASWLMAAFLILLIILFSGVVGIGLFALGISWLIINAGAVFLCMYIKIKINQGLERSMGRVNKLLIKHKIVVGLDDRGRISCHKVHLCFIYLDPAECIKRLEQILDAAEDRQKIQRHLDSADVEIVITGSQNPTRIPQKQSEALMLRYLQRWCKDFMREFATSSQMAPLHCPRQLCPCQYISELVQQKKQSAGCAVFQRMAENSPLGDQVF